MKLSRNSITRMIASLAAPGEAGRVAPCLPRRVASLFGLETGLEDLLGVDALSGAVHERWPGDSLVFSTSGSTGAPKPCRQDMALLKQEARFLAGLFAGRGRVAGLVPPHHIYGFLFTVLLPEILGVPAVDLDALSLGSLPDVLKPGDLAVGFPLLWRKCGELGFTYPADVTGVTSTGPCPPEAIAAALRSGLTRMAEIHGSTETGGIGYRFDVSEPYRLMDHWLAIEPGGGLKRNNPRGKAPLPFTAPDELAPEGGRLYRPAGRKDKAVQVAGVNVWPERVRRVLVSHPLVADAAVRPMRPEEGDRLKAFVVPAGPAATPEALLLALRAHLARELTPPEIPRDFVIGPRLPSGGMGKAADWDASVLARTLAPPEAAHGGCGPVSPPDGD